MVTSKALVPSVRRHDYKRVTRSMKNSVMMVTTALILSHLTRFVKNQLNNICILLAVGFATLLSYMFFVLPLDSNRI